jgi:hydroxyacylglutathione hydrolase
VIVLVTGFPAGAFAANCYLVAPAPGEECVIIDPGQDAQRGIEELLDRYRLKPIAVLLTHGHIDHMWSVAPVCGAKGIPAYIHPDDREMLADPAKGMSLMAKQQFLGGLTFSEPDDVKALRDGEIVHLAGLDFQIGHTPGHTPGSVTFRSTSETPGGRDDLDALFTGDLLFAGSIGRTDLPGGDHETILRSLARTLTLPDATVVLPGHGPTTTIGDERKTNPFLAGLKPAQKGL